MPPESSSRINGNDAQYFPQAPRGLLRDFLAKILRLRGASTIQRRNGCVRPDNQEFETKKSWDFYGPTLIDSQPRHIRTFAWSAFAGVAYVLLFSVSSMAFQGDALRWASVFPFWMLLVWLIYLVAVYMHIRPFRVGENWLCDDKGRWVDIYRLTEISFAYSGVSVPGRSIQLIDTHGRVVRVKLSDLYDTPSAWNIVYKGIRHSITQGKGVVDPASRTIRGLPHSRKSS